MRKYYLLDEIIVPSGFEEVFDKNVDKFKELYQKVQGVTQVIYLKTKLEAFTKSEVLEDAPGAENLVINLNPEKSYLLLIVFESQEDFQNYHDNSDASKQIHQEIAEYFDNKQLTIRAALHGEEI